jgi:hypothetical protein
VNERPVDIEVLFIDGSTTTLESVHPDDIEADLDACEHRWGLRIESIRTNQPRAGEGNG